MRRTDMVKLAASTWMGALRNARRGFRDAGGTVLNNTPLEPRFNHITNSIVMPTRALFSKISEEFGSPSMPRSVAMLHELGHAEDFNETPNLFRAWTQGKDTGTHLFNYLSAELEANNKARSYLNPDLQAAYNDYLAPAYRTHKTFGLGYSTLSPHGLPTDRFVSGVGHKPYLWRSMPDPVSKSIRRYLQQNSPIFDQRFRQLSRDYQHVLSKQAMTKSALTKLAFQSLSNWSEAHPWKAMGASLLPGVGTGLSLNNAVSDFRGGRIWGGVGNTLMAGMGLLPGGGAAGRVLGAAGKRLMPTVASKAVSALKPLGQNAGKIMSKAPGLRPLQNVAQKHPALTSSGLISGSMGASAMQGRADAARMSAQQEGTNWAGMLNQFKDHFSGQGEYDPIWARPPG